MKAPACAECGAEFTPAKPWQTFCGSRCQTRHRDLLASRGKVAVPLLLAWRSGRKPTTDDSRYAFAELCALADMWAREDKAAGRNATAIVSRKRHEGWKACDLG